MLIPKSSQIFSCNWIQLKVPWFERQFSDIHDTTVTKELSVCVIEVQCLSVWVALCYLFDPILWFLFFPISDLVMNTVYNASLSRQLLGFKKNFLRSNSWTYLMFNLFPNYFEPLLCGFYSNWTLLLYILKRQIKSFIE